MESAKSFDELQLALADLLAGKVEDDDLAKLMERSMVMAAGFGAAAGKEDADAAS